MSPPSYGSKCKPSQSPASHCGGPSSSPGYVEFVMDKFAREQVFSEYVGFLCRFSFHRQVHLLHTHHHLPLAVGTIGQVVADVPSGLRLTQHQETKKKLFTKPTWSRLQEELSPSIIRAPVIESNTDNFTTSCQGIVI
jgi:hypothetical protein